jgi:hypothetical protein
MSWAAPAKRSDDGAFGGQQYCNKSQTADIESSVALRLPPQSKTRVVRIDSPTTKELAAVRFS